MKKVTVFLIAMLTGCVVVSCDCVKINETSELRITDVGLSKYQSSQDKIRYNEMAVVQSPEELEFYIEDTSQLPRIDFSANTLLLVNVCVNYGIHDIDAKFYKNKSGYRLSVVVSTNIATVIDSRIVGYLVPKISDDAVVRLEITPTYDIKE